MILTESNTEGRVRVEPHLVDVLHVTEVTEPVACGQVSNVFAKASHNYLKRWNRSNRLSTSNSREDHLNLFLTTFCPTCSIRILCS